MTEKKENGEQKDQAQAEAVKETETKKASEGRSASAPAEAIEEAPPGPKPHFPIQFPDERLYQIKESHELLKQFTPKELKILLNLKRNTSPKAWTVREDLVVLTLPKSNREIAELLKDRNKEAVKKRLQLLKSKGLTKRVPEGPPGKK